LFCIDTTKDVDQAIGSDDARLLDQMMQDEVQSEPKVPWL